MYMYRTTCEHMYCMGQTKSQVRHFVRIFMEIKNTVNSCCTISILKNPQQFAWGWEIRHQTSKNRRILHESACMLAGGCTPKWAQLGRKSQFTGSFWRQPELTVPTVLLSEKYSCTDHVSTIAKHFPYGTTVPQVFTLQFGLHHTVLLDSSTFGFKCLLQIGCQIVTLHSVMCTRS